VPQVVTVKCFGFVVMRTADEAQLAIDNLNNIEVQGRTLTVEKVRLMNCKLGCILSLLYACLIDVM